MIYTSYFDNLKNLPRYIVPISICGQAPDWYKGMQYKKLAPKYSFFMEWKENKDNNYYIEHFNDEVLDNLNPHSVMFDLYNRVNEEYDICLICYERPDEFCHRHLVADWLNSAGYECKEWENC